MNAYRYYINAIDTELYIGNDGIELVYALCNAMNFATTDEANLWMSGNLIGNEYRDFKVVQI